MPATANPPSKAQAPHRFNKETARLGQLKAAMLRNARKQVTQLETDLSRKAAGSMPELSTSVRSNLALSVLRQSSVLADQPVISYSSIVGKRGKAGLMEALASLASSADKVFQWSQEQSASMIVNGSFTVIQAQPQSTCGITPTTGSVPAIIDVVSTPQDSQSIDSDSVKEQ